MIEVAVVVIVIVMVVVPIAIPKQWYYSGISIKRTRYKADTSTGQTA